MKISDSDNAKALLVTLLLFGGLSLSVGIVVKLFSKPQPLTTTINQYFVGNKEVNYGTIQRPSRD